MFYFRREMLNTISNAKAGSDSESYMYDRSKRKHKGQSKQLLEARATIIDEDALGLIRKFDLIGYRKEFLTLTLNFER